MEESKRLKILIEHWIEHNESHKEEYRKWAEKAEALTLSLVSTKIYKAIKNLEHCNQHLKEALESL